MNSLMSRVREVNDAKMCRSVDSRVSIYKLSPSVPLYSIWKL